MKHRAARSASARGWGDAPGLRVMHVQEQDHPREPVSSPVHEHISFLRDALPAALVALLATGVVGALLVMLELGR